MGSIPGREGQFVDHDLEGLLALIVRGELFLLQIKRLLVILHAAEDADVDVVGHRRPRGFVAAAVGFELLGPHHQGDLVFPVGSLHVGGSAEGQTFANRVVGERRSMNAGGPWHNLNVDRALFCS